MLARHGFTRFESLTGRIPPGSSGTISLSIFLTISMNKQSDTGILIPRTESIVVCRPLVTKGRMTRNGHMHFKVIGIRKNLT